jgi:hypothetical protein
MFTQQTETITLEDIEREKIRGEQLKLIKARKRKELLVFLIPLRAF